MFNVLLPLLDFLSLIARFKLHLLLILISSYMNFSCWVGVISCPETRSN